MKKNGRTKQFLLGIGADPEKLKNFERKKRVITMENKIVCPVCGSKEVKILKEDNKNKIYSCNKCVCEWSIPK